MNLRAMAGGHWDEGTYAGCLALNLSAGAIEKMPNIIKLSTKYGRLKAQAELALKFRGMVKGGEPDGNP